MNPPPPLSEEPPPLPGDRARLERALPAGAATAFPDATRAALEVLGEGGNAIDAAVAAAWALSVCEPSASGLGGQSTLLIYRGDGTVRIVDGHSYAPAAVSLEAVDARQQRVGHRACTIPSTPATLDHAQRTYGVLPRARVLAPAIRIAENGYAVTALQHRQTRWVLGHLRRSSAASSLFLHQGEPPPVGHLLRQPALARTLRRIAEHGARDFYEGDLSRAITEDMRRHGGLITAEDLRACSLPVEREPLWISYRGLPVASVPSPGGGPQLLRALKILERLLPSPNPDDSPEWCEAVALAVYASFREREQPPLGPEELTPSLADERIRRIAAEIRIDHPVSGRAVVAEGPGDTTHLTATDHVGNVVALTQSIQSVFGAKVANAELGFVYNNYLCSCPRRPHRHSLAGNCLPQSNAAPTLVFRQTASGREPLLALGAAGSRRIVSAILQVIGAIVDRGMTASEAVAAPRVHALLSGKAWIEAPAAIPDVVRKLKKHFTEVRIRPALSYKLGCVQALHWPAAGTLVAAADPRRDGHGACIPPTSGG